MVTESSGVKLCEAVPQHNSKVCNSKDNLVLQADAMLILQYVTKSSCTWKFLHICKLTGILWCLSVVSLFGLHTTLHGLEC